MSGGVGIGATVSVEHLTDLQLSTEITRLSTAVGGDATFPNEQMAATLVKLRREKLRRDFFTALDTLQGSDALLATATGVSITTE